jgi:hypothetical protein
MTVFFFKEKDMRHLLEMFLRDILFFYRSLTCTLQNPKVIVQYLDQLDTIPSDSDISGCKDDSEDDETWLPRVENSGQDSPPFLTMIRETSCSQILKILDSSQSLLSLWAVLEMADPPLGKRGT